MTQLLGFQEILSPVASGHRLLPGKVVGYTKLSYVPCGIALLMKQEPDPRMLGDEPDVMTRIAAAAEKSLQSCPNLCDPIDGSPQGSPVLGILEARIREWVAISFSNT